MGLIPRGRAVSVELFPWQARLELSADLGVDAHRREGSGQECPEPAFASSLLRRELPGQGLKCLPGDGRDAGASLVLRAPPVAEGRSTRFPQPRRRFRRGGFQGIKAPAKILSVARHLLDFQQHGIDGGGSVSRKLRGSRAIERGFQVRERDRGERRAGQPAQHLRLRAIDEPGVVRGRRLNCRVYERRGRLPRRQGYPERRSLLCQRLQAVGSGCVVNLMAPRESGGCPLLAALPRRNAQYRILRSVGAPANWTPAASSRKTASVAACILPAFW